MEHPITPPFELVQQWLKGCPGETALSVATQAAQWGADQELEACCEWLDFYSATSTARGLRAGRRPKPQSLRKQAYDALYTYIYGELDPKDKERTYNTIRRALEQLND